MKEWRQIVMLFMMMIMGTLSRKTPEDTHYDKTCFELPIVVVSPTSEKLPTETCNQPRFPALDCMKKPVEANIEVIDNKAGKLNCLYANRTAKYSAMVHYRGQSTLHAKKHQMAVNLKQDGAFLGFPADRKYVLNGPYIDGSLIRNHLAHWMFRGTQRYSPRTRHIVVFIRDRLDPGDFDPVYKGIYIALEKISYGPKRVGLAVLDNSCRENQLNGGWAWQNNPANYGTYSPNIVTDKYQTMFGSGERPVLMYPNPNQMTQTMRNYFVDTETGPLPKLFKYLYENMTNPDQLEDHIDIGSFVDYFLHTELSQDSDAYRRSAYFFKDRDQPINAGPVWDFNLAYGRGANQEDWLYKPHTFWKRLMCNYKMAGLIQKRWRQLRKDVWSDDSIQTFINDSAQPIHRQLQHCRDWTSDNIQCASVQVSGSYQDHVDQLLHAVLKRASWIDKNVGTFYKQLDPTLCVPVGPLPAYNCAADGKDDGCIKDPQKYIAQIEFPPIRTPYDGKPCKASIKSSYNLEETSLDPCWLAAGTYLTEGSLTPFCSGYGFCPPGPNAVCTCTEGRKPPTCARRDAPVTIAPDFTNTSSMSMNVVSSVRRGNEVHFGLLLLACVVFVALVAIMRLRRKSQAGESQPLLQKVERRQSS